MSNNFKPGDRCIIYKGKNLSKIVTLISVPTREQLFESIRNHLLTSKHDPAHELIKNNEISAEAIAFFRVTDSLIKKFNKFWIVESMSGPLLDLDQAYGDIPVGKIAIVYECVLQKLNDLDEPAHELDDIELVEPEHIFD